MVFGVVFGVQTPCFVGVVFGVRLGPGCVGVASGVMFCGCGVWGAGSDPIHHPHKTSTHGPHMKAAW